MNERRGAGLLAVVAWVVFPALPVVLENAYSGVLSFNFTGFADPHDWNWFTWLTELGPLVGFGFLAGATVALPDEPTSRRWPRAWLSRRWFWVAVGPWAGFLVWAALVWTCETVRPLVPDDAFAWVPRVSQAWQGTWTASVLFWAAVVFVVATLCYGWLVFAVAALRRAKRLGTAWASARRGLAVSAAFVGSLFGSFWAVTAWWRAYFFDPRVMPVLLAAVTLAAVCGCGGPVTYGEVRRRELFHAMLLAWTVGLALVWRWWARPRPGPPG
jgi:hypothetical protein